MIDSQEDFLAIPSYNCNENVAIANVKTPLMMRENHGEIPIDIEMISTIKLRKTERARSPVTIGTRVLLRSVRMYAHTRADADIM